MALIKHWKYLKYIYKHKLYVYQFGRKLDVGRLQLLLHDWHKFLPCEWFAYANFFYGEEPIVNYGDERNSGGCSPQEAKNIQRDRKEAFNIAWLKHQKRGKHHWQYWVLLNDNGSIVPQMMPIEYILEMVADWQGAGKAITGKEGGTKDWYLANKNNMLMHQDVRNQVEFLLGITDLSVLSEI